MSYPTMKLTVDELIFKMRHLQVGQEVGLAATPNGEYSYGIRRLPEEMFDNGMCWLADYYGGGATAAFSEMDEEREAFPENLKAAVTAWLTAHSLLFGDCVYVQWDTWNQDVWEFSQKPKASVKTIMACVNFELSRPYHLYVSVPEGTPCDDVQDIAKQALTRMTPGDFQQKVWDDSDSCDPYIDAGDIQWMEVDADYNSTNGQETDLPVGTVTK